ncbi:LysR family transcriptional regulator [Marinivivus vitaminiproducens]|uniref:LysR family transcriptional regulator n=1 Tax=Marinivivus vitaminiproducens TaxID=3035935 RepID=UPI002797EB0D|nr:LysR family transcriptional regulator [Geminicoccaceae bacterium SCSIO 64248]
MIDKLEILLALAREKHFGRAAESLGVTQQTLSAGLKHLEDRLGVRLVERGSRFQGLTPEGERVLDWARRIVADSRAMLEEIATLKRGLSGHLRMAVIPTALPKVVELTTSYSERHPEVRFTIESATSENILRLIDDLEVDAGLTYLDNEPLGRMISVPLYRERYLFLTMRGGSYDARRSITWAEAGDARLCLLTPNMQNRRIIDQQLHAADERPTPLIESNSTIVLLSHVQSGHYATIIPDYFVDSLGMGDRILSIPIVEPEISHQVGLVVAQREPMTPMVTSLVAHARGLSGEVPVMRVVG